MRWRFVSHYAGPAGATPNAMISATEALERLREGNRRAVTGEGRPNSILDPDHLDELASGQEPFAAILGCSDSRVPPEIIFDQAPGDLFVIRVAGNIATPTQVGSIEFAVENLNTPLVVVLGHSDCGAVLGTLDACRNPNLAVPGNLQAILDHIRPTLEPLLSAARSQDSDGLLDEAVHANVHAAIADITALSPVLANRVKSGDVSILGATYSVQTGRVDFFNPPDPTYPGPAK